MSTLFDRTCRQWLICSIGLLLVAGLCTNVRAQTIDLSGYDPNVNGQIFAQAVQGDGKAIVAGSFSQVGGQPQVGIARLQLDGTLDTSFTASIGSATTVYAIAVQPDGQVLIGGSFVSVDGFMQSYLARLHSDGSRDTTFAPSDAPNGEVHAIALQADGKTLIGGFFTSYGATARHGIARLSSGGVLDTSFNPGSGVTGTSFDVKQLMALPGGKLMVGGRFDAINGTARTGVARLRSDGTLDPVFDAQLNNGSTLYALALQQDGNFVLGGEFTSVHGTAINRIARVSPAGLPDPGFNPGNGANATINSIVLRPDGTMVIGGLFTTYATTAYNHIAGVNSNGGANFSFVVGSGAGTTGNTVDSLAQQSDGKLLLGGSFATVNAVTRNHMARLNPDGSLDAGFTSPFTASDGIGNTSVQPDGKILVGGFFSTIGGQARHDIARLKQDGTLDSSFAPVSGADSVIYAMTVQADDRVLLTGDFSNYDNTARAGLARVNSNGTLDTGFVPAPGPNGQSLGLLLQPDGKFLLRGGFSQVNNQPRLRIARVNSDGSLDMGFVADITGNDSVDSQALQPDGKIVIAGSCSSSTCATPSSRVMRLNSDGSPDGNFTVGTGTLSPDQGFLTGLLVQPDGRIIIAGDFIDYAGQPRLRVARLLSNGTLDTSFDPGSVASENITAVALQADGRVLIGGNFTDNNGSTMSYLARLNTDGSLDTTFSYVGINGTPSGISLPGDGRLIINGVFNFAYGHSYNKIVRYNMPEPATQSLSVNTNGTIITWLRGGSSPELLLPPTLTYTGGSSGDGTLGTMQRIAGGWQITTPNAINIGAYYTVTVTGFSTAAATFGDGSQELIRSSARLFTADKIFADGFE